MVSSRHGPGEMSPGLLGAPDRLPPLATAYIKTNLGKVAGTEVPVNPSVDSSRAPWWASWCSQWTAKKVKREPQPPSSMLFKMATF